MFSLKRSKAPYGAKGYRLHGARFVRSHTCSAAVTFIITDLGVFILPSESTEELSKTVYSYTPAEKSSVQTGINLIIDSLLV